MRSDDAGVRSVACTRRDSTDTSYSSATPDAPWSCCAVRMRDAGDVGGVEAQRQRVDACRGAELGEAPDGEERELGQAARGDDGVGDLELHRLEVADALPELVAVAHVLDREVERAVDVAEHGGRRQRPRERGRPVDAARCARRLRAVRGRARPAPRTAPGASPAPVPRRLRR